LYDPDPQVFLIRQMHSDQCLTPAHLPLPFLDSRGKVTKILVDSASLELLGERFSIDPGYLEWALKNHRGRQGVFYLNPPSGAFRCAQKKSRHRSLGVAQSPKSRLTGHQRIYTSIPHV
jgi:hypothetical protein